MPQRGEIERTQADLKGFLGSGEKRCMSIYTGVLCLLVSAGVCSFFA